MPIEPGLIDANVLVYAFNFDVPQHAPSRALLEAARHPDVRLYVTSQILCEFYSVITNPKRVDDVWSSEEAVQVIEQLLALPGLHVLATPAQAVPGLLTLLKRHPVTGGNIFDLQIIAAMQATTSSAYTPSTPAISRSFPNSQSSRHNPTYSPQPLLSDILG